MADEQIGHCFKANLITGDGKPSIFLHNFHPDDIVDVQALLPTGATITTKARDGGEPTTWRVPLSVQDIQSLIERCRKLDEQLHE